MKRVKMIFLCLFSLFFNQLCTGQELQYTYPLTLNKYSEEVTSVELFSEMIDDFDTLRIIRDYKIESEAMVKRQLKEGKLVKIEKFKEEFEVLFDYDEKGNIQSRTMNRSGRSKSIEYELDQENLKIMAIVDGIKKQETYFDLLNREIAKVYYSTSSRGDKEMKTVTTYEGERISKKEWYENEVLQNVEKYHYVADKLKHTKLYDEEENLVQIKNFKYSKNREDIEIIRFDNKLKRHKSLEIKYFDEKENVTKVYRISFVKGKQVAHITEFRLSFK